MEPKAEPLPPEDESGPPGRVRPFANGFLATVFTLGIYPFYWHYITHDELGRYLGRPNRLQFVWFLHILFLIVGLIFIFAVLWPAAEEYEAAHGPFMMVQPDEDGPTWTPVPAEGRDRSERAGPSLGTFLRETGLDVPFVLILGAIELTFAGYVAGQYRLLHRHLEGAGPWWGGALGFLVLIWIGQFGGMLVDHLFWNLLFLFPIVLAYFNLQSSYNDLWRDVRRSEDGHVGTSSTTEDAIGRSSAACDQCGQEVRGAGTAGAELVIPCPSCGWRNTLRIPSEEPRSLGD